MRVNEIPEQHDLRKSFTPEQMQQLISIRRAYSKVVNETGRDITLLCKAADLDIQLTVNLLLELAEAPIDCLTSVTKTICQISEEAASSAIIEALVARKNAQFNTKPAEEC